MMYKALIIAVVFFLSFSVNADEIAADNFGYKLTSIDYQLKNIQDTGTNIGLDEADDKTVSVPIGFSFSFYGVEYTEVEISSNGFLTFSPTTDAVCCDAERIPTEGGDLDNYIAGYWQDFDLSQGGTIRTANQTIDGQQAFVIGFYQLADNDYPEEAVSTFEIILYQGTNDIEFQYAQIQYDVVDNKVMGIENLDGTDGIELAFYAANGDMENGVLLHEEQGYCFSTEHNCEAPPADPTPIPEPPMVVLFIASLLFITRRFA